MRRIFGFIIAVALMLAGCGGGGGGTTDTSSHATSGLTVSGHALAGAPMIGFVWLKDSTGETLGPEEIASDGSFSFNVNGLTAPFFLRAQGTVGGQGYDMYSVATGVGTANINPLTNVIVANVSRVDPSAAFNDPATYKDVINDAALAEAVADLQTFLHPLLAEHNATDVNPLTGAFVADHTGLDAVLDVVKIEVSNTGTVTVYDKTNNNAVVAEAEATSLTAPTDPLQTGEFATAEVITEIQAIAAMLADLATALNDPNRSYETLSPFFASNYGVDDGFTRDESIDEMLLYAPDNITSLTNLAIEFSGSVYNVHCTVFLADGSSEQVDFSLINEDGSWKFKGNGYVSEMSFQSQSIRSTSANGTVISESGFQFIIWDNGNNGIANAIVTGPGLPAEGVTLVIGAYEPIKLSPQATNSSIYGEFWVLSDSEIDEISDNSVYTVVVRDASSNIIETRTWKVAKAPYKSAERTESIFPTLGLTSHEISAANIGGTLSFTYAKPTAFTPASMKAGLNYWGDTSSPSVHKSLPVSGTTGSLITGTPPSTPHGAVFSLRTVDIYDRETAQWWWFQ